MSYVTRYRRPAGLLDGWEESPSATGGRPFAGLMPEGPSAAPVLRPARQDEDDLLPPGVLALYRERLDADGLDFLKRGPRSPDERLAFAQRVHPRAHRTAEPLPETEQRRFRECGAVEEDTAFLGPDGIVYRRGEDGRESLAARIRRGFENAVGGYERPSLQDVLGRGAYLAANAAANASPDTKDPEEPATGQALPKQEGVPAEDQGPFVISPVPNGRIRGRDAFGEGAFGARRDGGRRRHRGIDIAAEPGASVTSAVSGTVTRIGYPYGDDLSYRYVEIKTEKGYVVRHFYVEPSEGLKVGDKAEAGRTEIGTTQDLDRRYEGITNHVHVEVRGPDGQIVDPTPWFESVRAP